MKFHNRLYGPRARNKEAANRKGRRKPLRFCFFFLPCRTSSMEIKRGVPVSPGVAIGPALVLDTEWFRIPQRFIEGDRLAEELDRLHQAMAQAAQEARDNQTAVTAKLGRQYGAIFEAHAQMIEDCTLVREI